MIHDPWFGPYDSSIFDATNSPVAPQNGPGLTAWSRVRRVVRRMDLEFGAVDLDRAIECQVASSSSTTAS